LFYLLLGDCTLTKIKIIENPGRQPVGTLKIWLGESLKKLNFFPKEIYFAFFENSQQLETLIQRYGKRTLSAQEISLRAKMLSRYIQFTAYLSSEFRNDRIPPIIIVKKDSEISKEDILHEVAHLKEDEEGWIKIIEGTLELLYADWKGKWSFILHEIFFYRIGQEIHDFFAIEMMTRYQLFEEVFKEKKRRLNERLKFLKYLLNSQDKFDKFSWTTRIALLTTLPPSYPQKEDEENLEKIVINHISQMGMEPKYRKIKAIVSQLESPPKVANIYKCGAEIIELALEFLEK